MNHIIIVSDIFGRTSALEKLVSEMQGSEVKGSVEILDPYHSQKMEFDNEGEAYSYFMSEVGLDVYTDKLLNRVKASTDSITLLGFSVGASAIWKLSDNPELKHITRATLFYSSQIRHYTNIEPMFPVRLIFPEMETGFSILELINALKPKKNVDIEQTCFLHGFMNPHSKNYNAKAYAEYKSLNFR